MEQFACKLDFFFFLFPFFWGVLEEKEMSSGDGVVHVKWSKFWWCGEDGRRIENLSVFGFVGAVVLDQCCSLQDLITNFHSPFHVKDLDSAFSA